MGLFLSVISAKQPASTSCTAGFQLAEEFALVEKEHSCHISCSMQLLAVLQPGSVSEDPLGQDQGHLNRAVVGGHQAKQLLGRTRSFEIYGAGQWDLARPVV